jgi:hypothetical protein
VFTARYALSPYIKQIGFVFKGLIIRHAKRMRRIILSSVASLAIPYFSTLPHKRQDFQEEKNLLNIKCVFRFSVQLLSKTFLILRIIQEDITNVHMSSCNVHIFLVIF